MRFRSAVFNPSLRAPTSYTRRMASEFWHGESTGADDDEVWSFAWEEASAAGLSGRAADKHANAALRMVQAREKVRAMTRAAGKKPGAAGKKPGKAKANPRKKAARNPAALSVTASVEQDAISGGWSVYLHAGRRMLNMTGDVFATKAAATREAKALLAQARAGVPLDTLGSMFWEKHHKPFLAKAAARNPRKTYAPWLSRPR